MIPANQERASVIHARTPSRSSPRTSTPSNSPSAPPPLPPRYCQSIGPILLPPASRSCSPSCFELSSIDDNVFIDIELENSELVTGQIKTPLSTSQSAPGTPFVQPLIVITGTMDAAEKVINNKTRSLNRLIRIHPVGNINEETLDDYKENMRNIQALLLDVVEEIENLLLEFGSTMDPTRKANWTGQIPYIENTFFDFKNKITARAMEVRKGMAATVDGTALQQEQNDLLRRQTEAQEKALQSSIDEKVDKLNETSRLAEEKRKGAVANANVKFSTLNDDINELGEKVNKVSDWEVESDLEVGRAMRAIKSWKEDLDKIVTLNRVLKEIVIKNDISDEEISLVAADALVNNVSDEVWIAVKAIESQDDYRALFTLDTTKQDPIKLPSFEGKDDEDFSVFKENMEKAFVQNRTCKADQLAKLKECLKGHAKRMVPDSITKTVEEAWADLDKAFGDPERLLKHRLESLFRLGTLPSSNVKGGFKKQIEWYLQAESLIRGVIVLGKTDEELDRAAFSSITINAILRLFPQYQMSKLSECHGKGQYKLEAIAEKISAFRLKAQDLQKVTEEPISFAAGNGSGSGAGGAIAGSGGVGGGKKPNQANNVITYNEMPALAMYKPPRRDDKCRICSTLEAEGDTSNLYDNHLNSFPTGCPRYIGMRVDQRFNIAAKAKFCLKCHDPEYIYKPKDPKHKCLITPTKKSRYTCTGKDGKCLFHMWTCCQHKNENEEGLKKFKEEINQRFNLDFAYVASLPGRGSFDLKNLQVRKTVRKKHSSGKRPVAAKVAEVTKKNEAMKATKRKSLPKPKEVKIPEVSNQVKDVMIDITSPEVVISVTDSNHKSLSTAEAAKKLKKKLSAAGGEVELRPIPKGKAQFMIGQTEGKTRPLLTLYDSGCGGLLLREGVPQKELTPAVLKTKGPYIVNGVGDTAVQVNDEWMCSLSLRDGSRQAVEGWTVDKITATLPSINMTQAEAEIKADKKNNEQLKNLKVEPVIGGDVDLLLGILYNGIFPVAVHSLTSGLTIYELQITSHKKSYNSVIGGPHESFQYLAQQAGSMNIVFAQLVQQLETYKQFGAPKLSNSLMSSEDLEFAMKFKEWEIENVTKHSLLEVDMEMCRHESVEELSIPTIEKPGLKELEEPLFESVENVLRTEEISCHECGNKLSKEKVSPA